MERVLIAAALVVAAAIVALVLNRRRPQAPTQGTVAVPAQLDRADFPGVDQPWLLVLWSSLTCASCAKAKELVDLIESPEVAVVELPWQDEKELHERYHVDDVPMILFADAEGVVRASFVGTPTFTELAGAVAAARTPSSDDG